MGLTKNGGALRIAIDVNFSYFSRPARQEQLTVVDQSHYQKWHQTTLGIVHEVAIPHPFFGLAAHFPLFAGGVPLWYEGGAGAAKVVDQVLHDRTGFSQHERLCGIRCFDGDHR